MKTISDSSYLVRSLFAWVVMLLLFAALPVFGQDAAPIAPAIVPAVNAPGWLLDLVTKYPWLATFVTVLGVFRAIAKPIWSLVLATVAATPTKADDNFIDEQEHSTWWKYLSYAIDWIFSIKVGPQAGSNAK
jgi:hypothetical protein